MDCLGRERTNASCGFGGWGEIRTHGGVAPTPVFKTGALNHSATHPAKAQIGQGPIRGQARVLSPEFGRRPRGSNSPQSAPINPWDSVAFRVSCWRELHGGGVGLGRPSGFRVLIASTRSAGRFAGRWS